MDLPAEHKLLLNKVGYPIPPLAELDASERVLITKFGYWLDALASGSLAPLTDDQHRFVAVARGTADPQTPHERAWVKLRRAPAGPIQPCDLMPRMEALARAKRAAAELTAVYEAKRAAIMERIQPELTALDSDFLDRMQRSADDVSRFDTIVREAVLQYGRSFSHARIRAVYARARITWDSKGLQQYAVSHPDVERYRKVGKPTVSLRFIASDEPSPVDSDGS